MWFVDYKQIQTRAQAKLALGQASDGHFALSSKAFRVSPWRVAGLGTPLFQSITTRV